MDVFSPFKPVPASQLQPSSIVLLNWNRVERTVALVVAGQHLPQPSFLLLSPGHPSLDAPGLFSPSVMHDAPVFVVPGALAVIRPEPANIVYMQHGGDAPAGALFTTPAGRWATMGFIDHGERRIFMLDNGEIIDRDWQRSWFPRWSIMAPEPNGEMQVLCEMSVPDQLPRN